jgi:mannosyltransferase OCH1-like enzyme
MINLAKKTKRKLMQLYVNVTELPMREIEKKVARKIEIQNREIPAVVYQTWINNLFGKTHAANIRKFRDLNPDMEFNLFDTQDLDSYMKKSWGEHPIYTIYKNAKFGPMKADIFRYCILYERGGYYFDIKGCCSIPISEICPATHDGLIAYESCDCSLPPDAECLSKINETTKYVVQWAMGFSKGHKVLEKMIESICLDYPFYKGRVFSDPKLAILAFTATGKFTRVVREEIGMGSHTNIYQAGIDFHGHGVYSMKGAEVRFISSPAYTNYKNSVIVS